MRACVYVPFHNLKWCNLPIVCIHILSFTPECGYFIQNIWHMFIDGALSSSLSNNSIIIAIPPWHVHVTKSPTLKSWVGALSKKSFTRSWYPTLYISGKIFRRNFRDSVYLKKFQPYRKRVKPPCQVYVKYGDIHSGVGGRGVPPLSKQCQITLSNYCQYCLSYNHTQYNHTNTILSDCSMRW